MIKFSYRKIFVSIIVTIAFIVAPISHIPGVFIQTAHAQIAVHEVGVNLSSNLKSSIENTLQTIEDFAQTAFASREDFKDFVLDPIAFYLAELALESITASIVNWINSGFEGSPAFVTDLEGYLLDVADQAAGEFIYGSELGFLCSPFELDVRIALAVQYQAQRDYHPQCTLSEVSDNIEGFLSGSFSDGGWPGWFQLTQNPVNNPTGAYLSAQTEFDIGIRNAQGERIQLLDFGRGFLSFEVCDEAHSSEGNRENCQVTTPGAVIQETLDEYLTIGGKKLVVADEFNEIISALFAQLAQMAVTGAQGLLGLRGSSYTSYSYGQSGQSSYLDALLEPDSARENIYLEDLIFDQIQLQEDFLDAQFEIIGGIDAVEQRFDTVQAQNSSCFSLNFPQELTDERLDAESELPLTEALIAVITAIYDAYIASITVDEQIAVSEQYDELQRQEVLFTDTDIASEELFIEFDLIPSIEDLNNDIDRQIRRCDIDDTSNSDAGE